MRLSFPKIRSTRPDDGGLPLMLPELCRRVVVADTCKPGTTKSRQNPKPDELPSEFRIALLIGDLFGDLFVTNSRAS